MFLNIYSVSTGKVWTAAQLTDMLDDDDSSCDEALDCSITDPDYQPKSPQKLSYYAKPTDLKIQTEDGEMKQRVDGSSSVSLIENKTLEPGSSANLCTVTKLENGEEVYLIQDGKRIFKARYELCSLEDSVHFQAIGKDQGRFFITKVYLNAASWEHFNEDFHSDGAAILWNLGNIEKQEMEVNHEPHGQQPILLENRKRKRNEDQWKQTIKKLKVNCGQEYTYKRAKTGEVKTRQARLVKEGCKQSCKRKCQSKINENERKLINKKYWQMGNINSQAMFLINLVQTTSVKRRVKKQASISSGAQEESRRSQSLNYHLEIANGQHIQVCKTFFLATLDISEKRIRTALSKNSMATVEDHFRGNSERSNHNRLEEGREEAVIEHIQKFTTVESHYVRAESEYCYLPSNLNLTKMHNMYVQWCRSSNPLKQEESYDFYRRTFNTRFKLKFHAPKKDQCDICESYKNTPSELKTEDLEKSHNCHIVEKNKARLFKQKMKEESKQDATTSAIAFDYQKTLLTPSGEVSSFYYSLRLKTYNFTLTQLATGAHACYVYTEEDAKKGSCEVASFLLHYLQELKKKGITSVHFFVIGVLAKTVTGKSDRKSVV